MTATDTTVVKGHLIEILNNDKTYVEGETVVYFANSLHEPACEVDSEYYVIFKSKNGVIRKYKTLFGCYHLNTDLRIAHFMGQPKLKAVKVSS
jgi:hypothetical protein